MAKPSTLPAWATVPGTDINGQPTIIEPSLSKKQTGWIFREKPPYQFMNWLFKTIYDWIFYIDDELEPRVTTAEGDITSLDGRLTTAESDILSLDGRVDDIETGIIKTAIDYSKPLGEVFFLPENKIGNFVFNSGTPRTYFPALNLARIEGDYVDCSKTNFPDDWVDYMNSINITYLEGVSGEVVSWGCSVTSVDVTFPNTISANAVLAALVEDATIAGGTYSRKLRLAGDSSPRTISTINLATRVVSLTSTPGVSGSISVTIPAYVGDSDTQCRIYALKGSALMAPNDPDGYFIMNLRTRGHFQGHRYQMAVSGGVMGSGGGLATGPSTLVRGVTVGSLATDLSFVTAPAISDGTNGTPLTRKITHGPGYTLIPYMWCGG